MGLPRGIGRVWRGGWGQVRGGRNGVGVKGKKGKQRARQGRSEERGGQCCCTHTIKQDVV